MPLLLLPLMMMLFTPLLLLLLPYCRLTPAQIHLTCAGGCQLRWILWQTRQGGAVTNVGEDPVEVLVIRVLAAELLAPRPRPALPVL